MVSTIRCSSEIFGDFNEKPPTDPQPLKAGPAYEWLAHIPPWATFEPIMWDRGTQREPDAFMHGLRAVWTEER